MMRFIVAVRTTLVERRYGGNLSCYKNRAPNHPSLAAVIVIAFGRGIRSFGFSLAPFKTSDGSVRADGSSRIININAPRPRSFRSLPLVQNVTGNVFAAGPTRFR